MRGDDRQSDELFSYVSIEDRVHRKHPLRLIREVVNDALSVLSCEAALAMIERERPFVEGKAHRRITLGGDKLFDSWDFVTALKERKITPHIAIQGYETKTGRTRKTAVDHRTTRHPGYEVSQIIRKRVEEVFGWTKYAAGQRQTKFRGLARVAASFTLTVIAYNLIRLPNLLESG